MKVVVLQVDAVNLHMRCKWCYIC